jgi:hypothetical protein
MKVIEEFLILDDKILHKLIEIFDGCIINTSLHKVKFYLLNGELKITK